MSTASRVSPLSGLVLSRGKYDPPQRYRPFWIIQCAIPFFTEFSLQPWKAGVLPHFTDEKTEAQKEDGVCPRSQEALVVELSCILRWSKAQALNQWGLNPSSTTSHLSDFAQDT